MRFVSTRHESPIVNFEQALLQGLAPDGGLYIPETLPQLFVNNREYRDQGTLSQLGEEIISRFNLGIPVDDLREIINTSLSFPVPLVSLQENLFLLEVFHGPTLAFKDVGARFMANVFAYFSERENQKVSILVATSGDTGSAIANAFHHMPNIDVYVLYPSKKVSFLQEQQMTTLGGNIHALEVEGTFDDCQRLVKEGLLDEGLKKDRIVTTANSINISRLLPQIIYHAWGVCQLRKLGVLANPVLVVPSGNLGNLTAAVYAKHIGFHIHSFIAATNNNAVFTHYLSTGQFIPQSSQPSLSNAMDVGNPSNFERLLAFYANDHQRMSHEISGVSISDAQTLAQIRQTYEETGYILDPHTAVGLVAANMLKHNRPMIITATAHPAKFPDVIKQAIDTDIELPERLRVTLDKQKIAIKIPPQYDALKSLLMKN